MPSPDSPLCNTNAASVVGRVLEVATHTPEATALVSGQEALTYGDLALRINAAASVLDAGEGESIIIPASSTLQFVVCYLAVHLGGAIAVPVDSALPPARLQDIQQRTSCSNVLSRLDQATLFAAIDEPRSASRRSELRGPSASTVADIMFTSGSTGSPKGVALSHSTLLGAAKRINAFVGTNRKDIEVLALPLSHSFGLGSLRCVLTAGGCVVLVSGFTFPGQIFEALGRYRATGFRCVPAGLATLFRLSGEKLGDFSTTLKYLELGSAPMPLEDKRRLMALLPSTRLCMHYGLTEATRSVYLDFHRDAHLLDSVGRPTPGVEVRICGEADEVLPAGQTGEIQFRGDHVMQEYWKETQRTMEALAEGWLHTGDSGYLDPEGYLFLQGRRTEMINVGGRKVSPLEVEQALLTHPQVEDCACTAITDPDDISGEAVAILANSEDEQALDQQALRKYLRDHLEPYKIPTHWFFCDEIPRTENGKTQRHILRQYLESRT